MHHDVTPRSEDRAEWRAELGPERYILREAGTNARSPAACSTSAAGTFVYGECAGADLFDSDAKFDSPYG